MTSQVQIGRWHEIVGDPTLGDAILDHVVHRAHRIELNGESLHKRNAIAEDLMNTKEEVRAVQPSVVVLTRATKPSALHSLGMVNSVVSITITGDHDRPD